ncbi:Ig-like domain-containing protein [Paraliomyxa miuraensis]|uniref:Ig-like domain-containing protein n=1 Tax=Paraliomyxa miuraensis TaxID=376150 RepID=UPI002252377C|nr:hypothetical protein [Paraliomyxa miuraensis]MCX4244700.1 hypothetical protein [Paraliomyxa miuraensis]
MPRPLPQPTRTPPLRRQARALVLGAMVLGLASATACNRGNPPQLLPVDNQVAVVGEPLVIQLVASDPEGDPLTFGLFAPGVPDLEATTSIATTPAGLGIFTFTPLASQIGTQFFELSVSDGEESDSVVVIVEVRGAVGSGSMPVFRSPLGSGTVLDLDEDDCVQVDIEVEDPDSSTIALGEMPPTIEGASLTAAADGRTGSWNWCPDRRQIETDDRYTLTLVADDGDNPPVTKDYVIVLRRRKGEDCPGQAPIITHAPMNFTTLLELPIVAEITDDQGLGATPYVVFAYEDPGDPIDFSLTTLIEMELTAGDLRQGTWRGIVPNVLANQPEGTAGPMFYLISATDDDDAEGDCDHRSDDPQSGMHRVTVTIGGNETAGPCDPCSYDVQCGTAADLCLPTGAGGRCGEACSGDGDCGEGYVCSPGPVESVEGKSARQCIPLAGSCQSSGGTCNDDDHEPDGTPAEAVAQGPLSVGVKAGRMLCANDDDWYAVQLAQTAKVAATLQGQNPPDMDLSLTTEAGVLIEASDGLSSSESLLSSCLSSGTYLLRVHSVDPDDGGSYTLELQLATAACGGGMGGDGDCCVDNNTPGCDDPTLEACVCALDAFCCDTEWDDLCAGRAAADCGGCGGMMGTNEDCCTAQQTPGCTQPAIQACVCALDPFCCNTQWDSVCVGRVGNDLCGPSCDPDDGDGPCCQANGTPGCEVNAVETCVCMADPFCCNTMWDADCVTGIATHGCGACPA